jgi:hypothetical protein
MMNPDSTEEKEEKTQFPLSTTRTRIERAACCHLEAAINMGIAGADHCHDSIFITRSHTPI